KRHRSWAWIRHEALCRRGVHLTTCQGVETSGESRVRGLDQRLEILHRMSQIPLRGSLHEDPVEDAVEWSRRQLVIAVELDVGGPADPLEQVLHADLPAVRADALE